MTMIDIPDELSAAFFTHNDMEETIRYLAEGRSLADWDDESLKSLWLEAWEHFLFHHSTFASDTHDDASAELRLRGLTPPRERISDAARQKLVANAREGWRRPEVRARIAADIRRFCQEWEKPRN